MTRIFDYICHVLILTDFAIMGYNTRNQSIAIRPVRPGAEKEEKMDRKTKKTLNIVNNFLRAEHAREIDDVTVGDDGFITIDGQLFTPAIDTIVSAIYAAAADRIVETAAMRPGYYFYIIASDLSAYDYEDNNFRDTPRRISGGRITGTAPARNPARGAMLVMRDYYRARKNNK